MNDELNRISDALDRLEYIQTELSGIAARTDDRRRADLVDLRRQLSAVIADVGDKSTPVLTRLCDSDDLRIYREKFSTMRSATALHQASWPAVSLDDAPDEHRQSAQSVRVVNRAFVLWMRDLLSRLAR